MRGKGKRVVDSSPTPVSLTKDTGAMVVWGEKSAGVEESVKKTGESVSGEAAEGLVQLGKNIDEPVLSEQETLADLLKRVTESYNPKKKGRLVQARIILGQIRCLLVTMKSMSLLKNLVHPRRYQ